MDVLLMMIKNTYRVTILHNNFFYQKKNLPNQRNQLFFHNKQQTKLRSLKQNFVSIDVSNNKKKKK